MRNRTSLNEIDSVQHSWWPIQTMLFVFVLSLLVVSLSHAVVFASDGTARGEATDEPGQQGLGLKSENQSSNVILGGPDIVEGTITKIEGELFSIHGNRGQEISLRVTKDTNRVCGSGEGTKVSTGQEEAQEHQEIPPTPFMEQRASMGGKVLSEQEMMQQLHEGSSQEKIGALSKDPSTLKEKVGTTDPKANEDVAKGSACVVGGEDCQIWGRPQRSSSYKVLRSE